MADKKKTKKEKEEEKRKKRHRFQKEEVKRKQLTYDIMSRVYKKDTKDMLEGKREERRASYGGQALVAQRLRLDAAKKEAKKTSRKKSKTLLGKKGDE